MEVLALPTPVLLAGAAIVWYLVARKPTATTVVPKPNATTDDGGGGSEGQPTQAEMAVVNPAMARMGASHQANVTPLDPIDPQNLDQHHAPISSSSDWAAAHTTYPMVPLTPAHNGYVPLPYTKPTYQMPMKELGSAAYAAKTLTTAAVPPHWPQPNQGKVAADIEYYGIAANPNEPAPADKAAGSGKAAVIPQNKIPFADQVLVDGTPMERMVFAYNNIGVDEFITIFGQNNYDYLFRIQGPSPNGYGKKWFTKKGFSATQIPRYFW